jgi:hypothetical protein
MAGGLQYRIATGSCAVVNRFAMLIPVEMPAALASRKSPTLFSSLDAREGDAQSIGE